MRKAQAEIVDTLNTLKQALGNFITTENVKSMIQEGSETTLQKIKDLEQGTNKHFDPIPIHVSATNTVSSTGNIVFSKVISEHESGYDQSTGKLTAKTAGYYYISCAIMGQYNTVTYIRLMHNGNTIAYSHSNDSGHHEMLPLVTTLKLEVGDVVYFVVHSGKIHAGNYGTFSAFMISPV